jgi:hypothetical protein
MSARYLRMGRQRPEDLIQKTVFQHIKQRGVEGLVALHVPNGGYRRPVEGRSSREWALSPAPQICCCGTTAKPLHSN